MDIIVYIGIGVAIIGLITCVIALWALLSKRYRKYTSILSKHNKYLVDITIKDSRLDESGDYLEKDLNMKQAN